MDGGIADPIPIQKALTDVVQKSVIVLTKAKGYQKEKSVFSRTSKYFYKEYSGLNHAMEMRWKFFYHQIPRKL